MDNISNNKMLLVAIVTSFITTFMGSALNLSITNVENYFNVSTASVGWIINSYMLTCAVLAVPMGIAGDVYGKRNILIIGLIFFSSSSIIAGFSVNIWMLIIIRAIQGLGTAMIYSTNIAILVENSEVEKKGRNLGIATGANYLGLSAGPVLGGFINYYFGWKGIFVASAIVSAIALLLAVNGVPQQNKRRGTEKNDYISLLRNKTYIVSNMATYINFGATFAISYMLSIFLQETRGYSSKTAGLILVCAPIIQAVASPVVGKLSDKFSPHKLSSFGMLLCTISVFLFSFIDKETTIITMIALLSLSGLGSGFFSAPNTNAVMSSVNKSSYGIASSILSTMRSLGHTTSTSIIMTLGDMKISFIVIGIACIGGIFMALYHKS